MNGLPIYINQKIAKFLGVGLINTIVGYAKLDFQA